MRTSEVRYPRNHEPNEDHPHLGPVRRARDGITHLGGGEGRSILSLASGPSTGPTIQTGVLRFSVLTGPPAQLVGLAHLVTGHRLGPVVGHLPVGMFGRDGQGHGALSPWATWSSQAKAVNSLVSGSSVAYQSPGLFCSSDCISKSPPTRRSSGAEGGGVGGGRGGGGGGGGVGGVGGGWCVGWGLG